MSQKETLKTSIYNREYFLSPPRNTTRSQMSRPRSKEKVFKAERKYKSIHKISRLPDPLSKSQDHQAASLPRKYYHSSFLHSQSPSPALSSKKFNLYLFTALDKILIFKLLTLTSVTHKHSDTLNPEEFPPTTTTQTQLINLALYT